MNMNSDPLAGLRDIHLPAEIGWWPPAPGWWFLFVLGVLLVAFSVRKLLRLYVKRKYRKEALCELKTIMAGSEAGDVKSVLQNLAVLLRRVAVHRSGRLEVAELSGDKWLDFLDRMGNTDDFTRGAGRVFGLEMYKPTVEVDLHQVFPVVERMIRKHK